MLPLDSPRWAELEHAYGSAADIPRLLEQLRSLPDSHGEDEPWFMLWSSLAHQGDVYSASFAAVPHVVAALASSPTTAGDVYFHFPAWVETCRLQKLVSVPQDLAPAYRSALDALPGLVAAASSRKWDADFLTCALAAIAASKGFDAHAEVCLALLSESPDELLKRLFDLGEEQ